LRYISEAASGVAVPPAGGGVGVSGAAVPIAGSP
jgi:hypothetical protein